MLWFVFPLLTAFAHSVYGFLGKKAVGKTDQHIVSASTFVFALIVLVPFLAWQGIPTVLPLFWIVLLVSGILNIVAFSWFLTALAEGDLSLTVPLLALSPLFLTITSPLIVGEFPSLGGLAGVLLVVIGCYVLRIHTITNGKWLEPFRQIWTTKASRYMLGVAVIYSIAAAVDKLGVQHSSPAFWSVSIVVFLAVAFLLLLFLNRNLKGKNIPIPFFSLISMGLFLGATILFQNVAVKDGPVLYVNAIKSSSILLSVIFGHVFLKEKGFHERFAGAILILIGIMVIRFFG